MADLTFKTKIDFGKIGGNKKLTLTSWNGGDYKFDIRDWYDNGNVGKGITLTKKELKALYDLLVDASDELEITEATFPDKIQKTFDELDKMFKGFKTKKDYGKMPFANGKRLQYYVEKGKKTLPKIKETDFKKLGVSHFITNKGNLYIYTL